MPTQYDPTTQGFQDLSKHECRIQQTMGVTRAEAFLAGQGALGDACPEQRPEAILLSVADNEGKCHLASYRVLCGLRGSKRCIVGISDGFVKADGQQFVVKEEMSPESG